MVMMDHKIIYYFNAFLIFKAWKFKGLSDESIKSPGKPDNSLAPKLKWILNLKKQHNLAVAA